MPIHLSCDEIGMAEYNNCVRNMRLYKLKKEFSTIGRIAAAYQTNEKKYESLNM